MSSPRTSDATTLRGTVAIVGRPNVGKSTLFNRLTETRQAITGPSPGVTRDRNYGVVDWTGARFRVVDTGGLDKDTEDPLLEKMRRQVEAGIDEADVVLLLVDGRSGLLPEEEEIGRWLRARGRPVILGVNKVDTPGLEDLVADFYVLGFEHVVPLSAEGGLGVGDLLDTIVALLPVEEREDPEVEAIKVAVVGKPNVGKSSLVNAIAGEERSVVHEMPGTTRDTVDVLVEHRDRKRPFLLLDTAGMKRRKHWKDKVDAVAVGRVERTLQRADVAVLMLDASEPPTHQDASIAGLIEKTGCAIVIALNKWDLVENKEERYGDLVADVKEKLRHVDWAPIITISVLEGERLGKLLDLVELVARNRSHRVATSELNRVFRNLLERVKPFSVGGKPIKMKYVTQASADPPTFILFLGGGVKPPESYKRFIINRLRGVFPLEGTPVRIRFRGQEGRGRRV